jgi:hypothetical protein
MRIFTKRKVPIERREEKAIDKQKRKKIPIIREQTKKDIS